MLRRLIYLLLLSEPDMNAPTLVERWEDHDKGGKHPRSLLCANRRRQSTVKLSMTESRVLLMGMEAASTVRDINGNTGGSALTGPPSRKEAVCTIHSEFLALQLRAARRPLLQHSQTMRSSAASS